MFDDSEGNSLSIVKIKKYFSVRLVVQLIVFITGLAVSGFGLFQLFNSDVQASSENLNGVEAQVCEKDLEFGRLTVDIGGAVKSPGVYELGSGSRMNDLIKFAGGFTSSVDKYYINKVLNLSQRLNDGEKFYIPTIEESLETITKQQAGSSGDTNSSGMISINAATKEELTSLTGIGEKRAEDIVAERPYESLNQLIEKEVLTESIFEKIKNDISL